MVHVMLDCYYVYGLLPLLFFNSMDSCSVSFYDVSVYAFLDFLVQMVEHMSRESYRYIKDSDDK